MSDQKTLTEKIDRLTNLVEQMALAHSVHDEQRFRYVHDTVSKLGFDITQDVEKLQEKLDRMQERLDWLDCLESAGVDNWPGIEYAYRIKAGEW